MTSRCAYGKNCGRYGGAYQSTAAGQACQRLGDSLKQYLRRHENRLSRNAVMAEIWAELLPEELTGRCRITGFSRGIINAQVEPGPYMHNMMMIKHQLIEQLRIQAPSVIVKDIQFRPANKVSIGS